MALTNTVTLLTVAETVARVGSTAQEHWGTQTTGDSNRRFSLVLIVVCRYASFDSIFSTMLIIFQCMTLEGWAELMQATQQSAGQQAWLFYIVLVWIFPLMTLNLFVATIRTSFTKARQQEMRLNKETLKSRKILAKDWDKDDTDLVPLPGGSNQTNSDEPVQRPCWKVAILWEFQPLGVAKSLIEQPSFEPVCVCMLSDLFRLSSLGGRW